MRRELLYLACLVLLTAGCNGEATNDGAGPEPPAARDAGEPAGGSGDAAGGAAATGKPGAPIDIAYDVIGTPVVGQPVSIDLSVRATQGDAPVRLSYKVLDTQSMSFPDTQARELALRVGAREPAMRQVTVVPQREGRLYLNVTAEMETEGGALMKSIAIPVQVGKGDPVEQEPGGTLKQDADGETVISLPADET